MDAHADAQRESLEPPGDTGRPLRGRAWRLFRSENRLCEVACGLFNFATVIRVHGPLLLKFPVWRISLNVGLFFVFATMIVWSAIGTALHWRDRRRLDSGANESPGVDSSG